MEPWEIAIEKLKELFATRKGPEWWSENIIDAHAGLKNKRDCFLFYHYLTSNVGEFNPESEMVTLDDIVNEETLVIPPYPEGMVVETYQNGPHETVVIVKNQMNVDDEKMPQ